MSNSSMEGSSRNMVISFPLWTKSNWTSKCLGCNLRPACGDAIDVLRSFGGKFTGDYKSLLGGLRRIWVGYG